MANPVTIYPDNTCWVRLSGVASVEVIHGTVLRGIGMQGDGFPPGVARFVRVSAHDARVFERDGICTFEEPATLLAAELATTRFWAE